MVQAQKIGFLEGLDLWLEGALTPDEVWLLGLTIRWWGRIGQAFQLVSGLAILTEIIGVDRIRGFGARLHGVVTPRALLGSIRESIAVALMILRAPWSPPQPKRKLDIRGVPSIVVLVCAFLGALIGLFFFSPVGDPLGSGSSYTNGHGGWIGLLAGTLVGIALNSLIALSGLLLDWLVIEPIAWILDREAGPLDHAIKVLTLALFLVGWGLAILPN